LRTAALLAVLATLAFGAAAGDETEFLQELTAAYRERRPLETLFPSRDMAAARALRDRFVAALTGDLGRPVGYKAALTAPAAQKRFGVTQPILGVLLADMIVVGETVIETAAPVLCEVDLLARVGDADALMRARTRAEALAALDAVAPFIELPDLVYRPGLPLHGAALTAVNAGARSGVRGDWLPLGNDPVWLTRLADFRVQAIDETGRALGGGRGADLLGHPLQAALWLRDALRAEGKALRDGDLLSLGSLTPLIPFGPGGDSRETRRFTARYQGLSLAGSLSLEIEFHFDEGTRRP